MRRYILLAVVICLGAWGGLHRQTSGLYSATSEAVVQQFDVESTGSGTFPFTVGLVFKEGDVPTKPSLDLADSQCTVKSLWTGGDGSVRHAICSGRVTLSAGVPLTVDVMNVPAVEGTALTEADIVTAAPSASVQLGSIGTVNLSSLLGSPVRTFISGPEMVEAHYAATVTDATNTLIVKFYVRRYADGRMWTRARVINDVFEATLDGTTDAVYVPTIQIDGNTVYNNGGAPLTQVGWSSYDAEAWIGGDPNLTITHDTEYMISTKMFANYWKRTPSESVLNSIGSSTYTPLESGPFINSLGTAGHNEHLGPLPKWDALYMISNGDSRAYTAVIAAARSIQGWPINMIDGTTLDTPAITTWDNWTVAGAGAGGQPIGNNGGTLTYASSHHPLAGYLAYLITGQYSFYESLRAMASTCYFVQSSGGGHGTTRIINSQDRQIAWCTRTWGATAAAAPDNDPLAAEILAVLESNIDVWAGSTEYTYSSGPDMRGIGTPGISDLGPFYTYGAVPPTFAYSNNSVPPWQQDFWVWAETFVLDLKVLDAASTTSLESVLAFQGQLRIGMLGPAGTDNYCFTHAGAYRARVSDTNNTDPAGWYSGASKYGTVFENTFGAPNDSCGNTLVDPNPGSGEGVPTSAVGQWANLLPAISGLVNHAVPGANAAWARLIGASNWTDQSVTADYVNEPNYGIVPWGYDGTCCE